MTPELSRPFTLERVGRMAGFVVEATPGECAALAARMHIPAMLSLRCMLSGTRSGDAVDVAGELLARVVQDCVVTAEPFEQEVAERFAVQCVPEGTENEDDDPDSMDQVPYAGNVIDLGELVAEQLALALDPYPRSPGATLPGEAQDHGDNPFAALIAPGRERRN